MKFDKKTISDIFFRLKNGANPWPVNAYIWQAREGGAKMHIVPARRDVDKKGADWYIFRNAPFCHHPAPPPKYDMMFIDAFGKTAFMASMPNPYEYHYIQVDIVKAVANVKAINPEEAINFFSTIIEDAHRTFQERKSLFDKYAPYGLLIFMVIMMYLMFQNMNETMAQLSVTWASEAAKTNGIMSSIADKLAVIGGQVI